MNIEIAFDFVYVKISIWTLLDNGDLLGLIPVRFRNKLRSITKKKMK